MHRKRNRELLLVVLNVTGLSFQLSRPTTHSQSSANHYFSSKSRFCIQVDEGALQSVLDDDPDHILESDGWVKLLWADKRDIQPLPEYIINPCGPTDLRYPVKESPWVMVAVQGLLPGMYNLLREWDDWEREYRAPPEVLCL